MSKIFFRFLPFWAFLVFFKFGGGLHYSLVSPLGEKLFPLWLVGLLMGGGSIVQLLLDVPAGHILDRYGYRRLLKLTTFVFLFAALCFTFGLTKTTYLLSLVISTFGWLFFGPGVNAYILSHAPKESAGRFISLRDVFGSVGIVLASAALPLVLLISSKGMGYLLFFLLFVSLIMLFFSPKDTVSVHSEIKIPTHHHYIRRHSLVTSLKAISRLNPASGLLLLLNLTGSIFYGAIWFTVPLVMAGQADNGLLGIGLGMFDFSIVLLGFLLGNLADKANRRSLVFFGLMIFSIAAMFLGFNFGWLFLLFGFLATAGDEMAGISLWSWLHFLDRNHDNDGAISGVINLFNDFGWAIGPIMAGFLYSSIGATWTLALSAIPIFILWIIYQLLIHKHKVYSQVTASGVPVKPHRARHRG
ncbi:MAG: MFS transporter [Candidatus Paceibacterota bacterium]|jgi:MFS family permease